MGVRLLKKKPIWWAKKTFYKSSTTKFQRPQPAELQRRNARPDAEAQMMIHDFGDDSNPHCTLGRNGS